MARQKHIISKPNCRKILVLTIPYWVTQTPTLAAKVVCSGHCGYLMMRLDYSLYMLVPELLLPFNDALIWIL